jgi:hypothetical protein
MRTTRELAYGSGLCINRSVLEGSSFIVGPQRSRYPGIVVLFGTRYVSVRV